MIRRRDWLKLTALGAPAWLAAAEIPARPGKLVFPELTYDPPKPADHRHELPGGAVAYLVEDRQLPLVSVSLSFQMGGHTVADGQVGLISFTGSQMRGGGTTSLSARELDEEAAFLATGVNTGMGATSGSAGMSCLTQNLDRSMELLFDVLQNPAFDRERFELSVARSLQAMERRNDDTGRIAGREWGRLLRGDHFTTRNTTKASIESITIERMHETHNKWIDPSRFIFAVAGDFDTEEMLDRLSAAVTADGWPSNPAEVPEIPKPTHTPKPGVFMVDKPDVNQSQIRLGHLGIERSNPDHIAVGIMNHILGGGGFTSRIMGRVRSDEGLAYSAGSSFSPGTYYPGTFSASFQSQNPKCAEAATLVLEEIDRMRQEKVSAEELDTAKTYSVEIFPRFFATAGQVAGTFASDERTGREEGYWEKYRERVSAVTGDDVQRVAQEYVHPDKLLMLGVGNVAQMLAGNQEKPQYSFEKLDKDGEIERIRLPDPLTMEYPEG